MTRTRPRREHRRSRLLTWGAGLAVLLVVAFLAGGWYFSGQIRSGLDVAPVSHDDDVRVVRATETTLTLAGLTDLTGTLATDKAYGLDWHSGYGRLTRLLGQDGGTVTRAYSVIAGHGPRGVRTADLRKEALPEDPEAALGVPVREVSVTSAAGHFPAWYAPGQGSTWAVLVHGKGMTRTELYRLMRSTTALGLPSLDISYRHDAENGGGLPMFGATEWPDLEAAVRFAVDHGARHVVLVGCSMGGAMSAAFLEHSPLHSYVSAMVLDAPMLDYSATVEQGAAKRSLPLLGVPIPGALTWTARQLAWLRYGLDPGSMDYLDDTGWVTVPTLVFHGDADATVPVSVGRRLAAAEPDLVELHVVHGADHVESWNVDPATYDSTVLAFLRSTLHLDR